MAREHRFNLFLLLLCVAPSLACETKLEVEDEHRDVGAKGNGALLFKADEKDAVEVTSAKALELGQGADKKLTVEGWIRIDRDIPGAIFSKRWTLDPSQTDYMLWVQPGLGLVWATGSFEDECAWMGVPLPPLGTWHHLAMTLEASGNEEGHKAFFMDGTLLRECDYESKGPAHDDDFLIGAAERLLLFHGIHDHFSGAIDELHLNAVILYETAFQPPQMIRPNDTTIAFWDFSVTEDGGLPDLSDHGHDGRVFGAQSINASR